MAPKQVKKVGMVMVDKDDLVTRISSHKGVEGVIICTRDGIPINTTMDSTATTLYVDGLMPLEKRCNSFVREIEPTNEVLFIRIASRRFDLSMAPRSDHLGIVIQKRNAI